MSSVPRKLGLRSPRVLVLVATLLVAAAISATAAMGGVLEDQLRTTRAQGHEVKQELSVVQRRQQAVVRQISALNAKLATLQKPVDDLNAQISNINARIDGRRRHIVQLKADFVEQKQELEVLDGQFDAAQAELTRRVVATYKSGDTGMIEQLAGAGNLRDLIDRNDAIGEIVGLDQHVIDRINDVQREVRLKRASNHRVQRDIRDEIASFQSDRAQLETSRAELQRKVDAVAAVKHTRDAALAKLRSRKHTLDEKLEGLEGDAKVLKEAIATGQVTYGGQVGNVSPAGLIWPVNGPIVSPFGWRWGRAHEGVDIAVGMGVPIHAAASGIVTYASWMNGYGNFVLIQHGGGLITAYGHQSKIAVHVGQPVSQGQVIGFVGCTGHCFGPHVHFETRHGETPVDPMQYL
jgi:murein DD-endopeptidase MepM/ murein hydrolase activator NlpD